MRIEKLKHEFDISVKLVHFPLHPESPAEGVPLQQLFRAGPEELEARHSRMKGLMDAEGLPYGRRTHTYNSRLAQELGKWSDTQPSGERIHDALYKAYFVDGRNIGDIEVLLDLVRSIGLNEQEAREVLTSRSFKAAVDADWTNSRAIGVTGVPTFVFGQSGVVGAQPYEVLKQLLETGGAKASDKASHDQQT